MAMSSTTATANSPSSNPLIQVLHLTHLPPTFTICIAQYTNLRNAPHLHAQLLSPQPPSLPPPNPTITTTTATTTNHESPSSPLPTTPIPPTTPQTQTSDPLPPPASPPPPYARINPARLLSPTHLYSAIFRACNDFQAHRLRTRSLHSEIVLSLGSTNNIAKTMGAVGLGREGREVVVVGVDVTGSVGGDRDQGGGREAMEEWLRQNVEGESVVFGDEALRQVCDVQQVRRFYKIQSPSSVSSSSKDGARTTARTNGGGGDGLKGPAGKEAKLERRRRRRKEEVEARETGGGGKADVVDGDDEESRRSRGGAEGEGEMAQGVVAAAEIEVGADDGGGRHMVQDLGEEKRNSDEEEIERKELEMQVLGLMALRGAG